MECSLLFKGDTDLLSGVLCTDACKSSRVLLLTLFVLFLLLMLFMLFMLLLLLLLLLFVVVRFFDALSVPVVLVGTVFSGITNRLAVS